MVRERDHGTHRRASPCRGTGDAGPSRAGRDGGAALPGDLAAGAGADDPRGGRGAGLRAAPGGGAGGARQRLRSRSVGDQRRRNGRPASLLTPALLAALAGRLKMPPADGGVWSGPKVAAWMARQLGLATVHPQRGWEALKRIEWSIQAPRPRHPRAATPEEQAACKGGSGRRWRGPGRRIPTGRSRSGPRTVGRTASDPPRPEAGPPPAGSGPPSASGRSRSGTTASGGGADAASLVV